VERFRGGLVFKARGLLNHSTLGSRVVKKQEKKKKRRVEDVRFGESRMFATCVLRVED
jgi:hypothetical protein